MNSMPIPDDAALAEWNLFLANLNASDRALDAAALEKLKALTLSLCELLGENERATETLTAHLHTGAQHGKALERQLLEHERRE